MSRLVTAATGLAVALHSGLAAAQHYLPPPVTPIAREIYDLHLLMLGICAVIFVGVFLVMFYSIYAHRKSVGHKAEQFHESTTVEIIWTIIPFFILIGMAWPATKGILALKDTSNLDLTIKAFGKQISDTDIAAVITYTRNAWTNKAAENLVQPADVKSARK